MCMLVTVYSMSFNGGYIYSGIRGYLARKKYRPLLERRHSAVIRLQSYVRGFVERRRYHKEKESKWQSAVKIQSGTHVHGMTRNRVGHRSKVMFSA